MPCSRSAASAKSIIMMAFFFTMPISRMMPMMAITSSSLPASHSASSAPTPAVGRVERIVIGWIKLSYSTPSTIYIATTAATTSQTVLPSADWKASELPWNWVRISVGKSSDCSAARIASTASPSE